MILKGVVTCGVNTFAPNYHNRLINYLVLINLFVTVKRLSMDVKKGVVKYQICKKKRVNVLKYDGKEVISADFSQNRQENNDIAIWKI